MSKKEKVEENDNIEHNEEVVAEKEQQEQETPKEKTEEEKAEEESNRYLRLYSEFENFRKEQTKRSYKEQSAFKSVEEYREYRDLKDQEEYEIFIAIKEQDTFEDFRTNKSKYVVAGESANATTTYDDQAAEVNRLTNLLTHLGAIEVKTKTLSKRHPSHEEQSTRGFAKGTNGTN